MRLAFFLAAMLMLSPLQGAWVDASHDTKAIGTDGFSLSLPHPRLYLKAGPLTVGEIDRRGLLRTLSEPHGGHYGLRLEASPFRTDGRRSGAVLEAGPLSVGVSLGDRPLAAASLSYEHASAAMLYALPGSFDESVMGDRKDSEGQAVLYGGASGRWWIFSCLALFSFSPDLGFDGFISASVGYGRYSLSFSAGSLPVLYDDETRYMYSISGSIGEEGFRSEFSLKIGNKPVFSDEYLAYEAYIRSRLELYGIRVYSSMEYSFSKRGKSSKSDRITIEAYGFKLGYDSDYGLVAVYDSDIVEFGYDEGRLYAAIETDLLGERSRMRIRLSSDSSIDVSIALDL